MRFIRIKRVATKCRTLRQRIKRRSRFLGHCKKNRSQNSHKVTFSPSLLTLGDGSEIRKIILQRSEIEKISINNAEAERQSKATQTKSFPVKAKAKMISAYTETQRIALNTTAQQTLGYNFRRVEERRKSCSASRPPPPAVLYFPCKSSQTELNTSTIGIQCKCRLSSGTSQTDELIMTSSSTQIWTDEDDSGILKKCEEYSIARAKEQSADQEVVIYMLNEIGELVLNQNHILSNNSKMMDQVSQLTILNRVTSVGEARRFAK